MTASDRRWAVVLVLIVGCVVAGQVGKVPPALPLIREDLGLGLVQAGWVATAINSVTATLGIALGLFAARLGGRNALLAGLALMTLGCLAGVAAASGAVLIASRVLESLGFVLVVVAAPSLLAVQAAADPEWRRALLVLWSCYMPLGSGLMLLLAPALLAQDGWRALWGWNALLLGLCLVAALARRTRLPVAGGGSLPPRSLRQGLVLPGPWIMGLCFACYSSIWFIIVTWLPTYAVSTMGFSLQAAAWLTAAAVLSNIGGNLSAHWLLARGLPRWGIIAASLVLIGSLGWLVFTSGVDPLVRSVAAVVACSVPGALPAAILAGVPLHVRQPAQLAVANATIMQCSNLGTFLGPPAIAALASAFGGWDSGRWLIPAVALVGIGASLVLRPIEGRALQPRAAGTAPAPAAAVTRAPGVRTSR